MEIFSNNKHPSLFCLRVNYIKKCYKASNSTFTGFSFSFPCEVACSCYCLMQIPRFLWFRHQEIFWKRFPLFHLLGILHKEVFFLKCFHHAWQFVEIIKKWKKNWRPNKFVKVVVYFMTSPYIKITEQRVDLIKLFDQDFSHFCLCKLDRFIDVHFCSLWSKLF